MTTTTRITIPGGTVQQYGLTVEWLRFAIADGEFFAEVSSELNCYGMPALIVEMTTESDEIGDAASEELVESVTRLGYPAWVAYTETK